MKLIKIEAHGFKSFAEPVILRFDGGVAGIIGPNGSGKSNINDAIKWVLGEQSSKEMRGDSMQDLIFAGSKTAKPMDFARVTLTFDNKDSDNSIDEDTVVITRELFRGKGINNYYLNGKPCRFKDIKSIAMETGIGKSSLAIISQGTVSDIAESSDDDRRGIFEEAAGVSKFKFKKTESLRLLQSADASIAKLEPTINELEKQLIPLRKQAEKALIYRDKSRELKKVEVAYLAHEIRANEKIYEELSKELSGVEETKDSYSLQIAKYNRQIGEKRIEKNDLTKEIAALRGKQTGIKSRLENLDVVIAKQNARMELIASGEMQVGNEEMAKAYATKIIELEQNIKYHKETSVSLSDKVTQEENKLSELSSKVNSLQFELNNAKTKYTEVNTNLQILNETKNKKTNLFKGTRTIVENSANFRGYKGLVRDLIKVQPDYVTAIEAILANASQHIVVDIPNTAVKAVEFLKKNKGGRATFIPLTSIKEKFIRDDYLLVASNHAGFIGVANELVEYDPQYDVLAKFLLGNVVVVQDIETANQISNILERKYMVVTLDGDIIRVGGVIVGGTAQESDNIIGLDDKIEKLQQLLPSLSGIIQNNENLIEKYNTEISRANAALNEYRWEQRQEVLTISQLESQLDEFKSKADIANINKDDVTPSVLTGERNELLKEYTIVKNDLTIKTQFLETLEAELVHLTDVLNQTQTTLNELNNTFTNKIALYKNSEINLRNYRERLATQYSYTIEYAEENYKLEIPVEKARELVAELREQIADLGAVNQEAIEQLESVEERYDRYVSDRDELVSTRNILMEAISELDKIIVTRLTNVVNDVNREFNSVFKSMFGGGSAEVRFVEPNNVLESGITIFAQPPGKSIKNLRLFSGGEKALIAISLLFAILRARPLPLCILDEVEAALDEANVIRYAEYLQELKKQTQFIVITHRTGTMSKVDSLFAATMQTRGVTSFFSVHLKDAAKYIDEPETV
ncbi:AAA family ATPase [Mycoplasmopsis verecunda]|uniref:Chromosome partition protein Smc n=1 Tax=Mycoplasmopsis verecunda TaxID=171291 RepID=A0A1T4KYD0_9BACT|nr:AAA family ATPase [Mycoplasmopsis verecunda]WPB54348.1 AAA family ATPase [Mycoplasmopsis verecunda]SJZ47439.1 chromosome segregation protein [Mycoplasmopsis verecunda]